MAKDPQQLQPHEMGPPVEFKAAGADKQKSQANLILSRSSPAFPLVKELIADAMTKNADTMMLDYTQNAVGTRYQVDGIWHNIGQRDRPTGDAMLVVMKKLADLNTNERRAAQEGTFKVEYQGTKLDCRLTSQGVQTGERVMLKLLGKNEGLDKLDDCGMTGQMLEKFKEIIDSEDGGMVIVAAMPGDGLTTTWAATLRSADRFMRDFVAIEEQNKRNPEIENVAVTTFDAGAGQTPDTVLPSILLKEPEALIVPDFVNGETINILCGQIAKNSVLVLSSMQAKEGVEALLRVLALKPNPEKYASSVKAVLYGRLVRRLCETCRQPYQPAPQLLQQLGLPAGKVAQLYRQWQPPPPEQLVDDKGRPIPPPVCPACGNMGFHGRTAIYELITVSDKMRQALIKQPKLDLLRKLVRESGQRTIREEGIMTMARGVTALNELQRVLKK